MKNLKTIALASAGLVLLSVNNVNAAISVDVSNGENITQGGTLVATIQTWISALMTLLYIVAVIIGLWGGFNILTAAGDEEKVKKGKTIILNAVIGLVVIFLVGNIMRWLIGLLTNGSVNG